MGDNPLGNHLPPALQQLVDQCGLPPDCIGLQIQSVVTGARPLANWQAEQTFQLASTAKVVTALAALDLLGPTYRWRTTAYLSGPISNGKLLGDLVIVGGGNALLTSADLLQWFAQMQAHGLREVLGNIVLDHQAFRLQESDFVTTPPPGADRPHHAWPDALTLDQGLLRIAVQGGTPGQPLVDLQPPLAGVRVERALAATGLGCEVSAQWLPPDPQTAAPRLKLTGQWPARGCTRRDLVLAPMGHVEFTQRAVAALWRGAGGRLRGQVLAAAAGTPLPGVADGLPPVPWLEHQGAALPQVLRDILKTSDNLGARNLMLSLVQGFPQRPATLADAQARVHGWLHGQGLLPGDILVDSGSGLSRLERGRPRAMVHLLRRAWTSRQSASFVQALPVAGVDGTLQHRLARGAATGRAFLKTGTLLDTRALAGYVIGASNKTYALTALVNHPDAARAVPMLDSLVEWVARQG